MPQLVRPAGDGETRKRKQIGVSVSSVPPFVLKSEGFAPAGNYGQLYASTGAVRSDASSLHLPLYRAVSQPDFQLRHKSQPMQAMDRLTHDSYPFATPPPASSNIPLLSTLRTKPSESGRSVVPDATASTGGGAVRRVRQRHRITTGPVPLNHGLPPTHNPIEHGIIALPVDPLRLHAHAPPLSSETLPAVEFDPHFAKGSSSAMGLRPGRVPVAPKAMGYSFFAPLQAPPPSHRYGRNEAPFFEEALAAYSASPCTEVSATSRISTFSTLACALDSSKPSNLSQSNP
ncbi:hypothetical protein FKP32DRAFT_811665 [Trametes sanguinea]|nr:hypothetical protein FKP32DRAFT_811665 [Trametes sanguinea]